MYENIVVCVCVCVCVCVQVQYQATLHTLCSSLTVSVGDVDPQRPVLLTSLLTLSSVSSLYSVYHACHLHSASIPRVLASLHRQFQHYLRSQRGTAGMDLQREFANVGILSQHTHTHTHTNTHTHIHKQI